MSDGSASIGYGFALPTKLTDESKIDLEDLLDNDESLDFMFFGDSYGENAKTFLVIATSRIAIYTWEKTAEKFDPTKLIVNSDWDKKLNDWAAKHKVSKPKIGWYLCAAI